MPLLQEALDALAAGQRDAVRLALMRLADQHPDHPATRLAERALARLQSPTAGEQPTAAAERMDAPERPTTTARAELVSFQTLAGLFVGLELCGYVNCETARSTVTTLGLTTALGLGLSLAGSRDGQHRRHLVGNARLPGARHRQVPG